MGLFNSISRFILKTLTAGSDPDVARDPAVSAEDAIEKNEFARTVWVAEAWGRREALAPYLATQRMTWWSSTRVLILESGLRVDHAELTTERPVILLPAVISAPTIASAPPAATTPEPVPSNSATIVEFPDGWTAEARKQWQMHQDFMTAENRR